MSEFEITDCLVCSANNYLTYSKKGQFGLPTNVVICKKFGFFFLKYHCNKERNNNNYLTYSKKGQFGLPTNVVICKNCGFSYLNPRWNKERYHTFYTKEYDTYYRPEVISATYKYDPYTAIKQIV